MEFMNKYAAQLPKVLQDEIAMFNPEHRQVMKSVLDELAFLFQEVNCDNNCCCPVVRKRAINKNIIFNDYLFCSEWCVQDFEYEIRRSWRSHH